MHLLFFFFFQAEDGIRDIGVTGVQTCALPISEPGLPSCTCPPGPRGRWDSWSRPGAKTWLGSTPKTRSETSGGQGGGWTSPSGSSRRRRVRRRSEERRVGKERRSRWSPFPLQKNLLSLH